MRSSQSFAFWTLVPSFGILLALSLTSLVSAVQLSLTNRTLRSPDAEFVGAYNYLRLLRDPRFFNALEVSAVWQLITVLGTMLVAVGVAVLIFETVRSPFKRTLLCLTFLMPVLLPRVAAAFIWRFLYSPSNGFLNWLFGLFSIGPFEFLASPSFALTAVALVDIWQWGLFFAVIVLKLLETLPRDPIEAALLDNAKPWEVHAFVTLPMLRGSLISLALVKAVESLRSFDLIFVMTGGGPGIATETLDLYAYQTGINLGGRIAYASAMSVLLLIVSIFAFTLVWKGVRRWAD